MIETRKDIYIRILDRSTRNIRFLANRERSAECVLEVEHIHNLPKGILRDDVRDESYYWEVERVSYRRQADPSMASKFDDLWDELESALQIAKILE